MLVCEVKQCAPHHEFTANRHCTFHLVYVTWLQVVEIVSYAVEEVRQQAATWGLQGDLVLPEHSARSTAPPPSTRHTSRSHPGAFSCAGAAESTAAGSSMHGDGAAHAPVGDDEAPFPPLAHIPSETSRLNMHRTEDGEGDEGVGLMMLPPSDTPEAGGGSGASARSAGPAAGSSPAVAGATPARSGRKEGGKKPRPALAARIAARASERASQCGAAVAEAAGRAVRPAAPAAVDAAAVAAAHMGGEAHACVSSEHAELMRDMALSLMELHQKSRTSQVRGLREMRGGTMHAFHAASPRVWFVVHTGLKYSTRTCSMRSCPITQARPAGSLRRLGHVWPVDIVYFLNLACTCTPSACGPVHWELSTSCLRPTHRD